MASSTASTVAEYLASLPAERRASIAAVRKTIRRHLPAGYREVMNWGMISYEVPLRRYPDTYNGRPLCYAGLAAQKNHLALYLTSVYQDPRQLGWLKAAFAKAGKRLDMGKACVRFKSADDLPLAAIGQVIAGTPVETFITRYEKSRRK